MKKSLHANVEKNPDGTFKVTIYGAGYDVDALSSLFNGLEELGSNQDIMVSLPVVQELEDPVFYEELQRRLQSVLDGSAKTTPWEVVKKQWDNKRNLKSEDEVTAEEKVKIAASDAALEVADAAAIAESKVAVAAVEAAALVKNKKE